MSANLVRLDSDDPHTAGVLITFGSGVKKQVQWHAAEVISPALTAAKEYTASVLEQLLRENREAEIRDTNWVSVTAAMHKCIRDFNGKLHEAQRHATTLQ